MPPVIELSQTGYRNAVNAALAWIKAAGVPVDEDTFAHMAELRGDCTEEALAEGFIVRGYAEVQRLCELANMVVLQHEGTIIAMTPEDFTSRRFDHAYPEAS